MEQETTASDAGRLVTTRRDAVVELAITNPGARNALAPAMYAEGLRAFAEASSDPTVRAVMLHGADGFFCAGGNLNRLLANRARAPEHQRASVDQLNRWVLAIRACTKPVVAAVEGAAAGAGFSLALACDLIVAAKDAKFVMAYARVGLSPDGGAIAALAAALPPQRVFALCALAEPATTAELHAAGIVHHASEPARTLAEWTRAELAEVAQRLHAWRLEPSETEGYGKAEVTVGGVDTRELSSRTMECRRLPGLYFVGEAVDVTGWLGGYNFQWAWSSGFAAGRAV